MLIRTSFTRKSNICVNTSKVYQNLKISSHGVSEWLIIFTETTKLPEFLIFSLWKAYYFIDFKSSFFLWKLDIVWYILMRSFRYNLRNLQSHWTLEAIWKKNCKKVVKSINWLLWILKCIFISKRVDFDSFKRDLHDKTNRTSDFSFNQKLWLKKLLKITAISTMPKSAVPKKSKFLIPNFDRTILRLELRLYLSLMFSEI